LLAWFVALHSASPEPAPIMPKCFTFFYVGGSFGQRQCSINQKLDVEVTCRLHFNVSHNTLHFWVSSSVISWCESSRRVFLFKMEVYSHLLIRSSISDKYCIILIIQIFEVRGTIEYGKTEEWNPLLYTRISPQMYSLKFHIKYSFSDKNPTRISNNIDVNVKGSNIHRRPFGRTYIFITFNIFIYCRSEYHYIFFLIHNVSSRKC
jgi:hypothetical protein